jgi:V8-like Glu-specific endopeptidase
MLHLVLNCTKQAACSNVNLNENNMDIVLTESEKQSLPCGRSTDLFLCPTEETSQFPLSDEKLLKYLIMRFVTDPNLANDPTIKRQLEELNNITQAKQKQPIVAIDDHSTRYGEFGSDIKDREVEWEGLLIEKEALTGKKVEGSTVEINGVLLPSFLKYRAYWQNQQTVKNPDHDERQEVSQPTWPYNTSVRLIIEFPKEKAIGTGTVVLNSRTILTAGHCIYDPGKGDFANKIIVEYRDEQDNKWSYTEGAAGLITSGWFNEQKPSCDYGLIILKEPIGCNYLGLALEEEFKNLYINTAGFPREFNKNQVNIPEGDPRLYATFGVLKAGNCPVTLYHTADTEKGQSGSSVWTYGRDHKAYCCGIHTAGFEPPETDNKGILLSSVPFQRICQWINHTTTR